MHTTPLDRHSGEGRNPVIWVHETAIRLYPRQPQERYALRGSYLQSGSANLATQEQSRGRFYEEIRRSHLGLVRAARDHGVGYWPRESAQRMASRLEACVNRREKPTVVRSVREYRLTFLSWIPAFAGMTVLRGRRQLAHTSECTLAEAGHLKPFGRHSGGLDTPGIPLRGGRRRNPVGGH